MLWAVTGASQSTGEEQTLEIEADTEDSAIRRGNRRGMLVTTARPLNSDGPAEEFVVNDDEPEEPQPLNDEQQPEYGEEFEPEEPVYAEEPQPADEPGEPQSTIESRYLYMLTVIAARFERSMDASNRRVDESNRRIEELLAETAADVGVIALWFRILFVLLIISVVLLVILFLAGLASSHRY